MLTTNAQDAATFTSAGQSRSARLPVSRVVFLDFVRLADILAVSLGAVAAYVIYVVGIQEAALRIWEPEFSAATLVGIFVAVVSLNLSGTYRFDRLGSLPFQVSRASIAWAIALAILLLLAFMTKTSALFSRGWFVVWFATTSGLIFVVRYAAYQRVQQWQREGRLQTTVAIVGSGEEGARLVRSLRAMPTDDIRISGIYDDRESRRPTAIDGIPVLGTVSELIEAGKDDSIDRILIALPLAAEQRIKHISHSLQQLPTDIELSLDVAGRGFLHSGLVQVGTAPALRLVRKPLSDWHAVLKAVEDKAVSALILVTIMPVLAAIATAIKLDSPGPVLFRQRRFGFNNREIVVYKFRTMFQDLGDPSGAKQTVRNDPRVTRVGRFLRRSNLDELPQFINVLQGRLSVVGPRPHALTMRAADKLYHEAVDDYAVRHRVKPGITGWAQVNGLRGETDTMEKATNRVRYDLYYIDNWSLFFDIKIIFLTVLRGFRDPNAY